MTDWAQAIKTAEGIANILSVVVGWIVKAVAGDNEAIEKIKRVEQILTPKSPTESAFARAADIAARKFPRDDDTTPVETDLGDPE